MNDTTTSPLRARVASPAPEEIQAARGTAGKTQRECAALVYVHLTAYQKWELGLRKMHPAMWALMRLRLSAIQLESL